MNQKSIDELAQEAMRRLKGKGAKKAPQATTGSTTYGRVATSYVYGPDYPSGWLHSAGRPVY